MLAVPDESPVKRPEDLEGKIIATELVNTTRRWFAARNIKVTVEFSWGTTEIKARLLDGIVEGTETGSSLRANNLRIVDTLLTSTTRFVANKEAWAIPWKREKMENIAMLLKGAIEARAKVGLKMNVPEDRLKRGDRVSPRRKKPDGQPPGRQRLGGRRSDSGRKAGTRTDPAIETGWRTGIITYPLNKVIP